MSHTCILFFYSPIALGYSFLRYKMVVCVGVGVGGTGKGRETSFMISKFPSNSRVLLFSECLWSAFILDMSSHRTVVLSGGRWGREGTTLPPTRCLAMSAGISVSAGTAVGYWHRVGRHQGCCYLNNLPRASSPPTKNHLGQHHQQCSSCRVTNSGN